MALAHFDDSGSCFFNPVKCNTWSAGLKESNAPDALSNTWFEGLKERNAKWTTSSSSAKLLQSSQNIPLGFSLAVVERDSWPPGPPPKPAPEPKQRVLYSPKSLHQASGIDAGNAEAKNDDKGRVVAQTAIRGFLARGAGANAGNSANLKSIKSPTGKKIQPGSKSNICFQHSSTQPSLDPVSKQRSQADGAEKQGRATTCGTEGTASSIPKQVGRLSEASRNNKAWSNNRAGEAGDTKHGGERTAESNCMYDAVYPESPARPNRPPSMSGTGRGSQLQIPAPPTQPPPMPQDQRFATMETNLDDVDGFVSGKVEFHEEEGNHSDFPRFAKTWPSANLAKLKKGVLDITRKGRLLNLFARPKTTVNDRIKKLQQLAKVRKHLAPKDNMAAKKKRWEEMSEEERGVLQACFDKFDKDASGALDANELRQCLTEMGLRGSNQEEKREITRLCEEQAHDPQAALLCQRLESGTTSISKMATDGSYHRIAAFAINRLTQGKHMGGVDFFTFATDLVPKIRGRLQEMRTAEMMNLFMKYDADQSGSLSAEECLEVGKGLGLEASLINDVEKQILSEFPIEEQSNSEATASNQFNKAPQSQKGRKSIQPARKTVSVSKRELNFDQFVQFMFRCQEYAQRMIRTKEREIQMEYQLSKEIFDQFRTNLVMLHDIFKHFDEDNSGSLDTNECMGVFVELGLMPRVKKEKDEVLKVMRESDKDGGGTLDFIEFLEMVRDVRKYLVDKLKDELLEQFRRYDRDKSNQLSVNEISQLLGDLHLSPKNTDEQEEIRLLLLECDEDGSGEISFEEFQLFVQRVTEKLNAMMYDLHVEEAMRLGFSEAQMRDFRYAFDRLDEDGSNSLDMNEVRHVLLILRLGNVPTQKFKQAFESVDEDDSGVLDFVEFMHFMSHIRDGGVAEEPKLPSKAKFLDVRLLRRVLEYFRLSKDYIKSLNKEDLLTINCDYFAISPECDLQETLNVSTLDELYATAKRMGDAFANAWMHR